jgi:hypothetical protein
VVEHHLAMQAQDWRASCWAIGSRLDGDATLAHVHAAYDEGAIVRSWPMRGTVHAMPARDLPWLLELAGTRALRGVQRRWELLGIDEAMLERARDVAVELLRGGGRATRAQLAAAIEQAGIDLASQRAYHTVWYLATTGTLVLGPVLEGEQQLVLLDEWIPDPRRLDRDDALAELARRYLRSHAPATAQDLQWWTGLTLTDCRAALAACADTHVAIGGPDGSEQWVAREDLGEDGVPREADAGASTASTLALAAFDEHLLGYKVRDDVLDPAHAAKVDPGRNGVFRWTIVERGRVVATWSRTRRARHVKVELAPFEARLGAARLRAWTAAIERWGRFAGDEVAVHDPR